MKKMNNKGFTIVELVIVIAVIAILAAVMIPTFSGVVTKAQQSAAVQEVKAAYTETLASDLATNATSDDQVYNVASIIVDVDGILVDVSGGNAQVITTGTATHTLTNGKLQKN